MKHLKRFLLGLVMGLSGVGVGAFIRDSSWMLLKQSHWFIIWLSITYLSGYCILMIMEDIK